MVFTAQAYMMFQEIHVSRSHNLHDFLVRRDSIHFDRNAASARDPLHWRYRYGKGIARCCRRSWISGTDCPTMLLDHWQMWCTSLSWFFAQFLNTWFKIIPLANCILSLHAVYHFQSLPKVMLQCRFQADWNQMGASEDGGLYDKAIFGDREPILLRQVSLARFF